MTSFTHIWIENNYRNHRIFRTRKGKTRGFWQKRPRMQPVYYTYMMGAGAAARASRIEGWNPANPIGMSLQLFNYYKALPQWPESALSKLPVKDRRKTVIFPKP